MDGNWSGEVKTRETCLTSLLLVLMRQGSSQWICYRNVLLWRFINNDQAFLSFGISCRSNVSEYPMAFAYRFNVLIPTFLPDSIFATGGCDTPRRMDSSACVIPALTRAFINASIHANSSSRIVYSFIFHFSCTIILSWKKSKDASETGKPFPDRHIPAAVLIRSTAANINFASDEASAEKLLIIASIKIFKHGILHPRLMSFGIFYALWLKSQ